MEGIAYKAMKHIKNIRNYTGRVKSLLFEIIFNNTHLFVSSLEENNGISNKKRFGIERIISVNQGLILSIGGMTNAIKARPPRVLLLVFKAYLLRCFTLFLNPWRSISPKLNRIGGMPVGLSIPPANKCIFMKHKVIIDTCKYLNIDFNIRRFLMFAIICMIVGFHSRVLAQTQDTISIATNYHAKEGLQIKIFPTSPEVFFKGFEHGYNLYRAEVLITAVGGEKLDSYTKLNTQPIRRWDTNRLKEAIQKDSIYEAAIIFIEGAEELAQRKVPENADEVIERSDADDFLNVLALFASINSNKVSEALGLYFEDKSMNAATKYMYKIEVAGGNEAFTSHHLLFPQETREKEKVMGLAATLEPEAVLLKWFNNRNKNYPYYNIYRSLNKTKGYQKLNKIPYMGDMGNAKYDATLTTYIDSIPEYGKTYYYKVIGVNAFEEEGIPSDPVAITTHYLLKSGPHITDAITRQDNQTVDITWEAYPEEKEHIIGFTIKRAPHADGTYIKLNKATLSAKTRGFVDKSPKTSSNYYVVCAYGTAGDSACSVFRMHLLVDSIPPAKPQIVYGVCDTSGVVTIRWKKNTEPDMFGYRVFKTYDRKFEPIRVIEGSTSDTLITDTISLKQPYNVIYYRIAALDQHFNPSIPSDFFEVLIPDVLPPTNGYLKNYQATTDGINLTWQKSNAYDLSAMYLLRKSDFDFDYIPILKLSGDSLDLVTSYLDTTTRSNTRYAYTLQSEDYAGLRSEYSNVFVIDQPFKDKIPSVNNLKAYVSRENKIIKLTWDFPHYAGGFKLYRAKDKDDLTTYEFIAGNTREFYDKQLRPNTTYTYLLVAELRGGYPSGYSEKIVIKY